MKSGAPSVLEPLPASADAVALVEGGLAWREAPLLAAKLKISLEEFAYYIGISTGTFFARKDKKFTPAESDHIMRYALLWDYAMRAFEDPDGAATWLKEPQIGIRGAIPLDYARTETGARRVETLLQRIDFGITA